MTSENNEIGYDEARGLFDALRRFAEQRQEIVAVECADCGWEEEGSWTSAEADGLLDHHLTSVCPERVVSISDSAEENDIPLHGYLSAMQNLGMVSVNPDSLDARCDNFDGEALHVADCSCLFVPVPSTEVVALA